MQRKPAGRGGHGGRGGQEEVHRIILPRNNEVIGTVERAHGSANFLVMCSDKNERICSIPGRLKRRFWVKEGDLVLVKPWVVQTNERGDIIWRYSIMDRDTLKQRGLQVPD